jgi:prefoldin subunit 5
MTQKIARLEDSPEYMAAKQKLQQLQEQRNEVAGRVTAIQGQLRSIDARCTDPLDAQAVSLLCDDEGKATEAAQLAAELRGLQERLQIIDRAMHWKADDIRMIKDALGW